MITPFFRKTILISLVGHATAFSFLTFSFGRQPPNLGHTKVAFWGGVLQPYDFIPKSQHYNKENVIKEASIVPSLTLPPQKKIDTGSQIEPVSLKPQTLLAVGTNKSIFMAGTSNSLLPPKKRESVVMLYPQLPYHFNLYFKDRQVVYIELEYSVISKDKINRLVLKRKTSSGNLEADLLCMRYLNLYLSMQQDRLMPDKWHTVKIELEPKK